MADPVDLGSVREHACAVLSPAQQAELGFGPTPAETLTAEAGACVWTRNDTGARHAYVLTVHATGDPLAASYRDSDRTGLGDWAVFEPRPVGDLPAVARGLTEPADQCEVVVGAGGGQGISVQATVRPALRDRLVSAAELVIETARAG